MSHKRVVYANSQRESQPQRVPEVKCLTFSDVVLRCLEERYAIRIGGMFSYASRVLRYS